MDLEFIRDVSTVYASFFSFALFMILFESRYPKKKTMTLTLAIMGPLMIVNFAMVFIFGPIKMGTVMLLSCSLPSLIFFWFLSKHRGGRFFFTFCFADTLILEIIYSTSIIDYYIGNTYIFIIISRLIVCPLVCWLAYKYMRKPYISLQNYITKGWYVFTAIALIFYIALSLGMTTPTKITERPEYIPAYVLWLILMPVLYFQIFRTLRHQKNIHEMAEKESILNLQVSNITERIEQFSVANEKFRIERHDFRHKLETISTLIKNKEYDELDNLINEYNKSLEETKVKRYCKNAVVDAALAAYIQQAESKSIKVTTALLFPETLPVNDAELATVFANAIENAIHACEKLPEEKRFIRIQVLETPGFMLQISNSFDGNVKFDKDGIPLTDKGDGHGFGTRSTIAFCEKNKAYYEFKSNEDVFIFRVTF